MKRGLIGPLGDDIPSIFPIVAGVLLFLGTLVYAGLQVDAKNNVLSLRKAGLGMAYLATEAGFANPVAFERACNSTYAPYAANQFIHFAITVKSFCGGKIDLTNYNPFIVDDSKFEMSCTDTPAVITTPGQPTNEPPNPFVLNYPIAAQCSGSAFGPGLVNVLVWRR